MKASPLRITLSLLSISLGLYLAATWGTSMRLAFPLKPPITVMVDTPSVAQGGVVKHVVGKHHPNHVP